MTTNLFPFKVLFCFEDEFKFIVEIKRTDIQSEDKSLVYKWLMIQNPKQIFNRFGLNEKQNENEEFCIIPLTFQSMDQANGEQIRQFAEGTLIWNADNVSFNAQKMTRIEQEYLPIELLELISQFLIR